MIPAWPRFVFDETYSDEDISLIGITINKITFDVYLMMRPFVDENAMFKDLVIEFVPEPTSELKQYNAVGLAWKDRNLNLFPAGLARGLKNNSYFDKLDYQSRTGVLSMEETHSIFMRLINNLAGNDVIHWLYNERFLKTAEHVTQRNLQLFGGSLKIVEPDVAYGWQKQQEIMDGIKSGKYKEGFNEYWSDPAYSRPMPEAIAAGEHELEHVREWLAEHPH
jgi:hypothetical protein